MRRRGTGRADLRAARRVGLHLRGHEGLQLLRGRNAPSRRPAPPCLVPRVSGAFLVVLLCLLVRGLARRPVAASQRATLAATLGCLSTRSGVGACKSRAQALLDFSCRVFGRASLPASLSAFVRRVPQSCCWRGEAGEARSLALSTWTQPALSAKAPRF